MELCLNEVDKSELVNRDWLTDKHISAVNNLLRKHHPTQAGLQDPVLYEKQIWRSVTRLCPDDLSRKFWSSENFGPGDQNSRKIWSAGLLFSENIGPRVE